MKEVRFFYDPELNGVLPKEEAAHAVRVLRQKVGDEIFVMDGHGMFCRAEITTADNHHCLYRIVEHMPQERAWMGNIHLAIAPTKLNDRMEWLAEKATEIGWDELTFLDTRFSERKVIKTDRIGRIVVSAVKQSHKAWMPAVNEMTLFRDFVKEQFDKSMADTDTRYDLFICHCYDEGEEKPFLMDVLEPGGNAVVMIGPEGDFSMDEVRFAEEHGFRAVSLGRSRLRTETAGLVAVHMMQIRNRI